MLTAGLINFFVVIVVQYAAFVTHAFAIGKTDKLLHYTLLGMAAGALFGIVFDVLFGIYGGMHRYELGFSWWFMAINGLCSFGFFVAHVFLLDKASLWQVFAWASGIGVLYELTNYFFMVWEWTFAASVAIEYAVTIIVLYPIGALTAMTILLRLAYGTQFRALPF